MPLLKEEEYYTYSDYVTWDTEERYELFDGIPYMMSPGPGQAHQEVSIYLSYKFFDYLKGKPCKVFHAPFDVRLNADDEDDTVFQPDLLVVCDENKLDGRSCKGAPDMVIEILSPSTESNDRYYKFEKYCKSGVREYWIVDTGGRKVQKHVLRDGKYDIEVFGETDKVPVHVLEGLEIDLGEVFEEVL